jgi:hypothetical protein
MIDCNHRQVSHNLSLIIIIGSIFSNTNNNTLKLKIEGLPTNYNIILKDDMNDTYNISTNQIEVVFNWDKNETDGIVITNINNMKTIFIQFESSSIKNSIIFSNEYYKLYPIYETLNFKKINELYILNGLQFDPYTYTQKPLDFYNYNNNSSNNLYQLSNTVVIIPYLQILNLKTCKKNLTQKYGEIIDCPDILPLLTQSEYDKKLKDQYIDIQNDILLANIERCKTVTYMTKSCDPYFNVMDPCQTPFQKNPYEKTSWNKFQLWWINNNIKSFDSCPVSPCKSDCETGYIAERLYNLKVIIINGGPDDLIISDPKGIYSKIDCEYKFKFETKIKLQIIPSPGYIVVSSIGCDRFVDNIAYINLISASVIRFYLKIIKYLLSIEVIGDGLIISTSHFGINCDGICEFEFQQNITISFRAIPKFEYYFVKWIGSDTSIDDICSITLNSSRTLKVEFNHI